MSDYKFNFLKKFCRYIICVCCILVAAVLIPVLMVGCDKDAKKGTDTTADDISIPETQLIPDTTVFEETGKETDDYTSEVKTEQTAPVITEDVDTSIAEETTAAAETTGIEETTAEITQPAEVLASAEEIEKVLKAYQEFVEQLMIIQYTPDRDQLTQEQWDAMTASFIQISPKFRESQITGQIYQYPYYPLEDNVKPDYWTAYRWSPENDLVAPTLAQGYYVYVNYKFTLGDLEDVCYTKFSLDKASMDSFMKAYNISSTILSTEYLSNIKDVHRYPDTYKYLDSEIYPQLNIDADLIQKSTSEQLQVLLDVLDALIDININCKVPESKQDDTNLPEDTEIENTQPTEPVASIEEIERVLTAYQRFADELKSMEYKSIRDQIKQEQWNASTASFIQISPITKESSKGEKYQYPYYLLEDNVKSDWWWARELVSLPTFEQGYYICVNYKCTVGDREDVFYREFCLDKESMDSFMKAYNISTTILDREFLRNIKDQYNIGHAYENQGGVIYPKFNIDKDLILNSTPEQLQALLDILNAIHDINLYGKIPDSRYEYLLW
ncbi:MAG: hypothetical protein IKJ04_08420 [Clostridia bacterium]|nr:hypothetical protein [Clostridia bacterium]